MIRPSVSQNFDFEGELAVVIGRGGRHIRSSARSSTSPAIPAFVDGSVRDYQFSVTSGKNFPGTGPLLTLDRHRRRNPDPTRLTLPTRSTEEVVKSAPIFSSIQCPDHRLLLRLHPLAPGDVIATGTPEGVGHRRNPPLDEVGRRARGGDFRASERAHLVADEK